MARQRRGGFRGPQIGGTLGTLLRTTLQQAGAVREVLGEALSRGAQEGRARLDDFRSERRSDRRRQDALADLGEIVLDLVRRGEIDLGELPEAREVIEQLDALDDEAAHDERPRPPLPASRRRFDERREEDGTVSSGRWTPPRAAKPAPARVWRPTVDDTPPAAPRGGIAFDDDPDGDLADYMHPDDVPDKDK